MQRIRINNLQPGQVFAESLFLRSGQKLLASGMVLTEQHMEAMSRYGTPEVILAADLEELESAGLISRFDAHRLGVGKRAEAHVYSRAGHVVIERGQEIEEHHLDAFREGGAYMPHEGDEPPAPRTGPGSFLPNDDEDPMQLQRLLLAESLAEAVEEEAQAMSLRVAPRPTGSASAQPPSQDWPDAPELAALRSEAVITLRRLFARIEAGIPVSVCDFEPLLNDLLGRLKDHPTRFTQLALLLKGRDDYLPDHAFTAAVLSMAIAGNLNWPRSDVRQVGLAALTYDLGMLLVPHRIRVGGSELTDMDRGRIRKHPLGTLMLLDTVQGVPTLVKLAALQHHERENGAGYPRKRHRDEICDYARVLAVADAFAAAMSPRHYRKQKLPYVAMEETLREASKGLLWAPACRALVQAAGLFPVGSFVKLSTGQRACVLGSNPVKLDRPLVQVVNDRDQPLGDPIDLAHVAKTTMLIVQACSPMPDATGPAVVAA